jgi:hypothetical protein
MMADPTFFLQISINLLLFRLFQHNKGNSICAFFENVPAALTLVEPGHGITPRVNRGRSTRGRGESHGREKPTERGQRWPAGTESTSSTRGDLCTAFIDKDEIDCVKLGVKENPAGTIMRVYSGSLKAKPKLDQRLGLKHGSRNRINSPNSG